MLFVATINIIFAYSFYVLVICGVRGCVSVERIHTLVDDVLYCQMRR